MDDIEKRLKDATDACLKAHGEWSTDKKNSSTREALMEAVHELRKVAARLEIEIAISERDEMASKPIPIPSHRSNKRKQHDGGDDSRGNTAEGGSKRPSKKTIRRTGTKDSD